MLKKFAIGVALCFPAVIAAAGLGLVAINVVPCSWFGSGFEGGCGLGAVIFFLTPSAILAVVLAITFNVLYFKRKNASTGP